MKMSVQSHSVAFQFKKQIRLSAKFMSKGVNQAENTCPRFTDSKKEPWLSKQNILNLWLQLSRCVS